MGRWYDTAILIVTLIIIAIPIFVLGFVGGRDATAIESHRNGRRPESIDGSRVPRHLRALIERTRAGGRSCSRGTNAVCRGVGVSAGQVYHRSIRVCCSTRARLPSGGFPDDQIAFRIGRFEVGQ